MVNFLRELGEGLTAGTQSFQRQQRLGQTQQLIQLRQQSIQQQQERSQKLMRMQGFKAIIDAFSPSATKAQREIGLKSGLDLLGLDPKSKLAEHFNTLAKSDDARDRQTLKQIFGLAGATDPEQLNQLIKAAEDNPGMIPLITKTLQNQLVKLGKNQRLVNRTTGKTVVGQAPGTGVGGVGTNAPRKGKPFIATLPPLPDGTPGGEELVFQGTPRLKELRNTPGVKFNIPTTKKGEKLITLSPGQTVINSRGNVVAKAPQKPTIRTVRPGEKVVDVNSGKTLIRGGQKPKKPGSFIVIQKKDGTQVNVRQGSSEADKLASEPGAQVFRPGQRPKTGGPIINIKTKDGQTHVVRRDSPEADKLLKQPGAVAFSVTTDKLPVSTVAKIDERVSQGQQGLAQVKEAIRLIRQRRSRAGLPGTLRRAGQETVGIIADLDKAAGTNLLGFVNSAANLAGVDIKRGVAEKDVANKFFDEKIPQLEILENALAYRLARINKTSGRLTVQDVTIWKNVVKLRGLRSVQGILGRLSAIEGEFNRSIGQLRKQKRSLRGEDKAVPRFRIKDGKLIRSK